MKQLKFRDLIELFSELTTKYTEQEVLEMPVYLGTDDELNGIHCAWYRQLVNVNNEEDNGFVELINERSGNFEIKDKAILIS